ncbi:hypothetical protein PsYK624_003230 [Phanerochaete sordida]|uniref:Uncharacterized protein n=1 Tax=Phanerochaete sordida TaxID=48140 RepID=A0A9P3FW87_9APHY|nr:hypothetical protein PsYK624_003230 [Phanerochaete sordida]
MPIYLTVWHAAHTALVLDSDPQKPSARDGIQVDQTEIARLSGNSVAQGPRQGTDSRSGHEAPQRRTEEATL